MVPDFSKNNIEAEILELSQKIAEKRKQLEQGKGIVDERSLDPALDRELVKSALAEKISNTIPQPTPVASSATSAKPAGAKAVPAGKSYLDYLDEESRATVEQLVDDVFTNGLEKTLKELTIQEPFIIDAFHDVLTDKIHDELKKRGAI